MSQTRKEPSRLATEGLSKDDAARGSKDSSLTQATAYHRANLKEARRRRDRFLTDIEGMAEWREDLAARVARFTLKFTHVDCLGEEYEALLDEVNEFLLCAYAFAGGKGGAL